MIDMEVRWSDGWKAGNVLQIYEKAVVILATAFLFRNFIWNVPLPNLIVGCDAHIATRIFLYYLSNFFPTTASGGSPKRAPMLKLTHSHGRYVPICRHVFRP